MSGGPAGAPSQWASVIEAHRPQYADPIGVSAGETVRVHREDEGYPGWWWCTASDGREGWVPLEVLQGRVVAGARAHLLADYDASDLAVTVGELVSIERETRGWAYVRNSAGRRGWVPATHLRA